MRAIFLFFLFSIVPSVYGSVIYLSPQGDDNTGNGSIDNPWFTLEKAWKASSTGDTIYLRGGTYAYSTMQDLTGKDGSLGNPIKIWAFPGEQPVLTKALNFDMQDQAHLIYVKASYLHFKGLEISHFEQQQGINASSAFLCYTSHSTFEGIDYHHNGLGMNIRGNSTGNKIINCDFHHNYDPYNSTPYQHADGLDVSEIPSGTINIIRGCRFFNNADDGLDLWNNEGNVIIDSCWSWNNGYREDGVSPGGDGAGFKLGQTSVVDNSSFCRTLTHNISAVNRMFGITQNAAICKMFICNNVLFGNKDRGIYFSPAWGDLPHIIKNNISFKNTIEASVGIYNPIIDHNTWQLSSPITDECFMSSDWTQLAWPRNADGSLPEIDFMRPVTECFLIDGGADVGIPYWDNAPDIGAFERITEDYHFNQLPVVSIVSPIKDLTYTSPANVEIEIMASDPDGSVVLVELFNGTEKVDERTTYPYSFTLKEMPAGTYSLKAMATDNSGAISTSAIYNLKVTPAEEPGEYFSLFPNPNNGRFTVDFTSLFDSEVFTLTIVDIIGNTVYREELSRDESTMHFDLSDLNSGIYVIMISANQILLTQKFIKS